MLITYIGYLFIALAFVLATAALVILGIAYKALREQRKTIQRIEAARLDSQLSTSLISLSKA